MADGSAGLHETTEVMAVAESGREGECGGAKIDPRVHDHADALEIFASQQIEKLLLAHPDHGRNALDDESCIARPAGGVGELRPFLSELIHFGSIAITPSVSARSQVHSLIRGPNPGSPVGALQSEGMVLGEAHRNLSFAFCIGSQNESSRFQHRRGPQGRRLLPFRSWWQQPALEHHRHLDAHASGPKRIIRLELDSTPTEKKQQPNGCPMTGSTGQNSSWPRSGKTIVAGDQASRKMEMISAGFSKCAVPLRCSS